MRALIVKAILGVAVVSGGAAVAVTALAPGPAVAVVIKHVDGDTIDVRLDGGEQRVRLLNLDTPESVDPDQDVQCLGPEASAYLAELLPVGTEVTLGYDDERVDSWGRTLAAVFRGDTLINAEVARAGLGIAVQFGSNDKYLPQVQQAQNEALQARRGLYSDDVACTLPAMIQQAEIALSAAPPLQSSGAPADLDAAAALADGPLAHGATFLSWAGGPRHGLIWAAFDRGAQDTLVRGIAARMETVRTVQSAHRTTATVTRERERAEADRVAAEKAETDRRARERAAVETAEASAPTAAAPRAPEAPGQGSSGSGRSGSSGTSAGGDPYPGYTGPRCYAPGGKTWRPC